MDFMIGLPKTRAGHDTFWAIVDRLTESSHFLAVKIIDSLDKLARTYIYKIIRLHEIPVSVISVKDPRFTSRF